MQIYFDMCCIQRPQDDSSIVRNAAEATAVRWLIKLIEAGKIDLIASAVHSFELMKNVNPDRRAWAESIVKLAFDVQPITQSIVDRSVQYRGMGIREFDSLHLACAVESETDYFLTCDDKLLKKAMLVNTGHTMVTNPVSLKWEEES
jgi:predicted nucleic acid-binding protein